MRVALNGAAITDRCRANDAGQGLVGLVDGLAVGRDDLSVSHGNATAAAALTLVNHPIEGPVISGPHEQPFVCETEAFELLSGDSLGAPLDQHCSVERRIDYAYRSTDDATLKPLADPRAARERDHQVPAHGDRPGGRRREHHVRRNGPVARNLPRRRV